MTIELEPSVQKFFDLAKKLQQNPATTAETAMIRLVEFYRDVRITNATLD